MTRHLPTIDILGARFARLGPAAALAEAERLFEADRPAVIAFANTHTINLAVADASYMEVLNAVDLLLNDGKGVMLAARLLGRRFLADLNGNFFTPLLLGRAAHRGWTVYLMGGRPGIAERAARNLEERIPGLKVIGARDGYFSDAEAHSVAEEIRSVGPDLLLVALGNPKQERWLARNLGATGARLGAGVGGFVDFQAGEVARAPVWMNRMGIEWIHRLFQDPGRMWHRYVVGNPLFVVRVLRYRTRVR